MEVKTNKDKAVDDAVVRYRKLHAARGDAYETYCYPHVKSFKENFDETMTFVIDDYDLTPDLRDGYVIGWYGNNETFIYNKDGEFLSHEQSWWKQLTWCSTKNALKDTVAVGLFFGIVAVCAIIVLWALAVVMHGI